MIASLTSKYHPSTQHLFLRILEDFTIWETSKQLFADSSSVHSNQNPLDFASVVVTCVNLALKVCASRCGLNFSFLSLLCILVSSVGWGWDAVK